MKTLSTLFAVCCICIPWHSTHADSLSPTALAKLKQATVFVKAQTIQGESEGSGFFVGKDLIVTNAHVVGMKSARASEPQKLLLVLNSGNAKDEREIPGKVIYSDHVSDLAFIRVARQPRVATLELVPSKDVLETQPVFIAGYPLGAALTSGRNPAVTIATGTISSIRRNKHSQIEELQIDGSLIPGNSGGPIVDSRARVVGVSVSTLLGTQIGFSIPADSVRHDLRGRIISASLKHEAVGDDAYQVQARVKTIDPLSQIDAVALYYWLCPVGTKRPLDPQGKFPTHGAPGDGPKRYVKLTYDRTTQEWKGTIPKFRLTPQQDIWIQPATATGRAVSLTGAVNHSYDIRGRNSSRPPSTQPPNNSMADRLKNLRSGRSSKPNGSSQNSNRGVLGRTVPNTPTKLVDNSQTPPVQAEIQQDDLGNRYTFVVSKSEKVKLGESKLLQMVPDPTGGAIYAIFEGDSSVHVFDTAEMSLAGTIAVAKDPISLWCDANRIYVACDKSKLITVIDSVKFKVLKAIRVPGKDLAPVRIAGRAPDGSIMTLWKTPSASRWNTKLYLVKETGKSVLAAEGDFEWCAYTGRNGLLWTQHNFRGSPSGVADVYKDGERFGSISRSEVFKPFGGLHRDCGHAFNTFDLKGLVVPISARGMEGAYGYATRTMVLSPDLSRIDFWLPGSAVAEVPSQDLFVTWRDSSTKEKRGGPEILYASRSNGAILRKIKVLNLKPHPACYPIRNATPNIIYVPGREYFLFHDMNSQKGEIDLIRCGPVISDLDMTASAESNSRNDPPTKAYVGKPFAFTPNFKKPDNATTCTFRLKRSVGEMKVDPANGKISFTPSDFNLGLYEVELVADIDDREVPVIKWTLEIDFAP